MDPKPPPSHSSSSYTSFPILIISILGILTTAILLLSYYIFVMKCRRPNWRRPHHLLLLLLSRSRRFHRQSPQPNPQHFLHPTETRRGLDSSTINSIPTFRFSNAAATSSADFECAVCLADFRQQQLLRLLPNCSHAFHIDCIDTWLQSNANCPLCRAEITLLLPIQHLLAPQPPEQDSSVVIEMRDAGTREPTTFWHMKSMGDECIDMRGERDERFVVQQPIRRSFSMDSSNDRQLYVSVQEILRRQNQSLVRNEEGSGGGGSGGDDNGRIRRSFFSFSFGRSSRSAVVLPVQSELL